MKIYCYYLVEVIELVDLDFKREIFDKMSYEELKELEVTLGNLPVLVLQKIPSIKNLRDWLLMELYR